MACETVIEYIGYRSVMLTSGVRYFRCHYTFWRHGLNCILFQSL